MGGGEGSEVADWGGAEAQDVAKKAIVRVERSIIFIMDGTVLS